VVNLRAVIDLSARASRCEDASFAAGRGRLAHDFCASGQVIPQEQFR
jgi:hypothetical protein